MSLRVDRKTQLQVQVVQQLINHHTKGTGGPIPVTLHCNIGSSLIIFENGVHFVSQASIYTSVSESRAPQIRPSKKVENRVHQLQAHVDQTPELSVQLDGNSSANNACGTRVPQLQM